MSSQVRTTIIVVIGLVFVLGAVSYLCVGAIKNAQKADHYPTVGVEMLEIKWDQQIPVKGFDISISPYGLFYERHLIVFANLTNQVDVNGYPIYEPYLIDPEMPIQLIYDQSEGNCFVKLSTAHLDFHLSSYGC
ncbi:hypothetical protein A2382_00070 [Candidatus Woesebacteria bacterium RIFOXYB1_FULL_38_16]|uniref:Transmembrane protein n=1 Tax=Candidatus Woesebacteria bacterium RIFOXYB1_FULL_38_16 TaxID=1802538 RepID=A0A1F8CUW0_9BACT|nr:MAG: hypothetical protein A2191_01515 [Candidatus Woesebacteria bacterium RIFOXYA1_FULL_38_9]OGM79538.1 MAG: hypothetical protein A2382_00070 [Candidatus Woesebacteria bacterium RIFOXYB1_FULL_38_16]